MGTRLKTFDSTGTSPNGRLFAGDLNAIQDQYADQSNLAQTLGVGTIQVGEAGLQISRYGASEMRVSGALRTDGILRGLGGLFAGTFTTTQRNAISSPPFGLLILNTTTAQFEWNAGTPTTPSWQAVSPPAGTVGTSGISDGAVTSAKIADGTIAYVDIANSLKPSLSAISTDEALRALGTAAGTAAAGDEASLVWLRRAIVGRVNSGGSILNGSGFSVSRTGTGVYSITFSASMVTTPVVVGAAEAGAAGNVFTIANVSVNGFTAYINNWHFGNVTATDGDFAFHALPSR